MTEIVLAVHGGAGNLPKRKLTTEAKRNYDEGLIEALEVGRRVLLRGGSAINAVTEAVGCLENNQRFNAGKGAVLCADGSVELSASIMNGKDRSAGAVVGAQRTKNPIKAARALIGHRHGLLFGNGADAFASAKGLEMVEPDYFHTEERDRQWRRHRRSGKVLLDHEAQGAKGTVGAVAQDRRGNLAAATSTGGLVNQLPGRVGDTPIIGAGTWADNQVCAVSATGDGDVFARIAFTRRVADLIELADLHPAKAAARALDEVKSMGGTGGCILIDSSGRVFLPFTSPHMLRGWVRGKEVAQTAIEP